MSKKICVFCSSSDALDKSYVQTAIDLGFAIGQKNWEMVYGGTNLGLMGACARAAHSDGARITGVIPQFIADDHTPPGYIDQLLVTQTMSERKTKMNELSDAFVALPGGFGTLEEIIEVLTLRQLLTHEKPIVFINTNGFYDHLISFFEQMYSEQFAKPVSRQLYTVVDSAEAAIAYLESYEPIEMEHRWFHVSEQTA